MDQEVSLGEAPRSVLGTGREADPDVTGVESFQDAVHHHVREACAEEKTIGLLSGSSSVVKQEYSSTGEGAMCHFVQVQIP